MTLRPIFGQKGPLFVTSGNPNYSGSPGGTLLAECRKRIADGDVDSRGIQHALEDWEQEIGVKKLTSAHVGEGDSLGDLLSDCAPGGWDFGVREDGSGNHNWCYFRRDRSAGGAPLGALG